MALSASTGAGTVQVLGLSFQAWLRLICVLNFLGQIFLNFWTMAA
jgi:hypothetical protein